MNRSVRLSLSANHDKSVPVSTNTIGNFPNQHDVYPDRSRIGEPPMSFTDALLSGESTVVSSPVMTDLFLINGFLGAGKTTFLKNRMARSGRRTGVLMNDVARIGFDAGQIKRQCLAMSEIRNGSIFCDPVKDSFIDRLITMMRLGLEEILIESSGMSNPSEMVKILEEVRLHAKDLPFRYRGSVCLIDARKFPEMLSEIPCLSFQVRYSHVLVINKCDLVDRPQLQCVRNILSQLNPQACIIESVQGCFDLDALDYHVFEMADKVTNDKTVTRNQNLILSLANDPNSRQMQDFFNSLDKHVYWVKGCIRIAGRICKVNQTRDQIRLDPMMEPVDQALINQLSFLTAQGQDSVSHLARMAERHMPGNYRFEL